MVTQYPPVQLEEAAESSNITLIVSHPWLQETFVRLLREAGITVSIAESQEDLLQDVNEAIDIVMVDVMAYQGQYHDLFKLIQQKQPGILIIALLSEHSAYHRDDVTRAGANGVVIKENADTELLPTLYNALSGCTIKRLSSQLLNAVERCETLKQEEVSELVEKKRREKDNDNIFQKGFGRRSFLKGSAAAAAVAGVAAATPGSAVIQALATPDKVVAAAEDKICHGVCICNCSGACRLKISVRDGKVVRTTMGELPDPEYNRICSKGFTHVQRLYSPTRLKHPLRRVGERGAGEWEQISWDEAINEISSKWKQYQTQFGSTALGFHIGGVLRASSLAAYYMPALLGGTSFGACDDFAINYAGPLTLGKTPLGAAGEPKNLKYAKTILCWSANPSEAQVHNWHFILDALENGAKLIVIDPNFTTTAAKADIHVPLRPGTDAALALAMSNIIIQEGWADTAFLKKSSVAPFLVKETDGKYLRLSDLGNLAEGAVDGIVVRDAEGKIGLPAEIPDPVIRGSFEINGIKVTTAYDLLLQAIAPYTPEKAAEICDIPVEVIREITTIYARNTPSSIYQMAAMDHYYNGHTGYMATAVLAIVSGNLGKLGAFAGYEYLEGWHVNWMGFMYPPGFGPKLSAPILEGVNIINTGKYKGKDAPLKSLYITGKNVIGNHTNRQAWIAALNKLELVVVADFDLSDSAQYADIVLPVSHQFEAQDMYIYGGPHQFVMAQEKAIEPLYECKTDYEITKLILSGMGVGQHFPGTPEELMKITIDTPFSKLVGLTYEKLMQEGVMSVLPPSSLVNGVLVNGSNGVFDTDTKRAQFYLENPKPRVDTGMKFDQAKERLPYWEPPLEAGYDNELQKKYPLHCFQEHAKWRTHTMFSHVEWLRELDPEPIVKLNPKDAAQRGIQTGDIVKVFNDRGYVVLKAVVNNGLRPGMINIPHGWQKGQFIDGHYQDLTNSTYHPFVVNQIFSDVRVEIEKR
ncbi:hypothetical protein AT727_19730 [Desulfitobacterium hafniense]|uniref:Stage 0 sporulation protein A homolog n=1 Tax=Desulfitobacterium hafniense TaxID=49338 RepID=A0A0W1JLI9_DESHA|nr:molybdopterin-dependent oxidoreductase [Desulfitobacterium hafniense]KTE92418.1 hypothetical protein AT727_19730 [Desulfitobacterium hafniense]